jgi:hypothetical protein
MVGLFLSEEEFCRTVGVLFEKVFVITRVDGFGLGASAQKMGVNVDFSIVWCTMLSVP